MRERDLASFGMLLLSDRSGGEIAFDLLDPVGVSQGVHCVFTCRDVWSNVCNHNRPTVADETVANR